jgi:hypothetical protein
MKNPSTDVDGSPLWCIQQNLQSRPKFRWQACRPGGVDEADVDQVAEVGAVFVAEGGEFHANEGFEVQDLVTPRRCLRHFRGSEEVFGSDFFTGKDNVDSISRFSIWAIQEHVEIQCVSMHKAGIFQGRFRGFQVNATEQDIDILGVAHSGFIDLTHPGGDRVTADHGIRHRCGFEGFTDATQPIADFFHGSHHTGQSEFTDGMSQHHETILPAL